MGKQKRIRRRFLADVILKGISKEYDLHTMGLNNVSVEFADGSLTMIVGAAGCGKSSLLLCIGGLLDITSGDLIIGGTRMNDVPPKNRDVCLMREGQPACGGDVFDNISYGLRLRGIARQELNARTEAAAELLGLTDKLRTRIKKLSEPDRRRVALARCVARRPSVCLIDEPLFNVSEEDRLALAADIKKAHAAGGLTFIVASSCGADAFLCGGRVIVMKDGRVVCEGTERELTDAPPDMFTASLVGEDPMSFFRVNSETLGVRRGDLVPSDDGEIPAEVIASSACALLVKPDADSPAIAVSAEKEFPVGSTVKLKIIRAARFDNSGKLIV